MTYTLLDYTYYTKVLDTDGDCNQNYVHSADDTAEMSEHNIDCFVFGSALSADSACNTAFDVVRAVRSYEKDDSQ